MGRVGALALASAVAAAAAVVPTAPAATPLRGTFSTTLSGQRNAFLNARWQLRLLPGSRYAVLRDGRVVVRGVGPRTATRLTFEDRSGPAACFAQPGSALCAWKLTGRKLTLTPIFESCPGRRAVLSTHPLTRQ